MKLTITVEPYTPPKTDDNDWYEIKSVVMENLGCIFESTTKAQEHNVAGAVQEAVEHYEGLAGLDIIPCRMVEIV